MALPINVLLNLVFQPIGLICAITVLFSIIGLAIINRDSANRMTVRLVAAIAFSDILAHIGELYASVNRSIPLESSLCSTVMGFRAISKTFYCFTNMAICFHLYRSLVLLKKSTLKIEFITWIATLVLVLVFSIMYWSFGAFSGVKGKVGCNPGSDNPILNQVFLLMMGFINVLTIIIGIVTTILGRRNLKKYINVFSATLTDSGDNYDQIIRDRKKMAERSFLYPLSTCITLPIEAIFLIMYGFGSFNQKLGTPKAITLGLSGVLTGIAFAIDPATRIAFRSAYRKFKYGNLDKSITNDQFKDNHNIPLQNK
jgi:hypothetical protein